MIGGMFILFLVLLLLNVPIAFSLGASSLFYLLTSNMNAAVLAQKFYAGIDSFTLLCIPGFMLAGALMNGGGITRRILNFCNAFLGHFTGSLGGTYNEPYCSDYRCRRRPRQHFCQGVCKDRIPGSDS